jgi:hypothetical protein
MMIMISLIVVYSRKECRENQLHFLPRGNQDDYDWKNYFYNEAGLCITFEGFHLLLGNGVLLVASS